MTVSMNLKRSSFPPWIANALFENMHEPEDDRAAEKPVRGEGRVSLVIDSGADVGGADHE